jgi:hypothetical protein
MPSKIFCFPPAAALLPQPVAENVSWGGVASPNPTTAYVL